MSINTITNNKDLPVENYNTSEDIATTPTTSRVANVASSIGYGFMSMRLALNTTASAVLKNSLEKT